MVDERNVAVFVTGTGTGVGKTVTAAMLARGWAAEYKQEVVYWKPVQTGDDDDRGTVARVGGSSIRCAPTCFSFALPASPDQAAAAEGREGPTVRALVAAWRDVVHPGDRQSVESPSRLCLVEGAGGLRVPLNERNETWVDLLAVTGAPVLVAAASGLGTINHTSLTLDGLRARAIPVLGVVLCGPRHSANETSLRRMHPDVAFHALTSADPDDDACSALARFAAAQLDARAQAKIPTAWTKCDALHVWHPYTQHKTAAPPLPITAARGVYLTLADGKVLLDGTSSWWVNTIGHGRPEIARTLATQQQQLDHVLFAGATHEPGAALAAKLAALTGGELPRAFFSDNGSTAVEVALKMVYQRWVNRGDDTRRTFVSFRGSYHGDTFGAMAVAASAGFHGVFGPLLFKTLHADPCTIQPSAHCPDGEAMLEERLDALDRMLATHRAPLAGIILEPLLQGAGGMTIQPQAFVEGVARLAKKHELPLILDEVFTGLGRVGAAFAYQRAGIGPDIVCVAKGLTGGNLPLAVTLAKSAVYDAFLSDERGLALLHGHSYTGNPIACATALTALAIMEREDLAGRARAMEARYTRWIGDLAEPLKLVNPRAIGGVLAFELPGTTGSDYFHPRAARVGPVAAAQGLLLRPLGNTVYLMPPLVIAEDELDDALGRLVKVVRGI